MPGPGCSSVGGGAMSELGAFYPNKAGDGLKVNPYSWNRGEVPNAFNVSPRLT